MKKTRCLTCQNEHPYRHAKDARRKKESKKALFEQVLAGDAPVRIRRIRPEEEVTGAAFTPAGPPTPPDASHEE